MEILPCEHTVGHLDILCLVAPIYSHLGPTKMTLSWGKILFSSLHPHDDICHCLDIKDLFHCTCTCVVFIPLGTTEMDTLQYALVLNPFIFDPYKRAYNRKDDKACTTLMQLAQYSQTDKLLSKDSIISKQCW